MLSTNGQIDRNFVCNGLFSPLDIRVQYLHIICIKFSPRIENVKK